MSEHSDRMRDAKKMREAWAATDHPDPNWETLEFQDERLRAIAAYWKSCQRVTSIRQKAGKSTAPLEELLLSDIRRTLA